MTSIGDLFQRDITRPIDGVIKADDRAGLMMELTNMSSPMRYQNGCQTFWRSTTTTQTRMAYGFQASLAQASRTC